MRQSSAAWTAFTSAKPCATTQPRFVDFIFTYLNANVAKMVSIPLELLIGARMCEVLPVNRTLGLFDLYKHVVLTGEPVVHEFAVHDRDVLSDWIRIQAVKLNDGVVITASDITQRKRTEEQTISESEHDPLTALPNRRVLRDRIEQAASPSQSMAATSCARTCRKLCTLSRAGTVACCQGVPGSQRHAVYMESLV